MIHAVIHRKYFHLHSFSFIIVPFLLIQIYSFSNAQFYGVEKDSNGVWWFTRPENGGVLEAEVSKTSKYFISKGVDVITFSGDNCPKLGYSPYNRAVKAKYGNKTNWAAASLKRLHDWNFNTIGSWSNNDLFPSLPQTQMMWFSQLHIDYLSDEFVKLADDHANKICTPQVENSNLLGYFTDNEIIWGSYVDRWPVTFRENNTILVKYLVKLGSNDTGNQKAIEFLKDRYNNSISLLNNAWNIKADSFETIKNEVPFYSYSAERFKDYDDFLSIVAKVFFKIAHDSIRKYDSNHLILGSRIIFWEMSSMLIEAEGPYVDVMSYNGYYWWPFFPLKKIVGGISSLTNKPVLISEYSFHAYNNTSKDPNTWGAGYPMLTQQDRCIGVQDFITQLMEVPGGIGYHWFQYADEPPLGRFDGEDCNFGLVDINDNVYTELVDTFTEWNIKADSIHSKSHEFVNTQEDMVQSMNKIFAMGPEGKKFV